MFQGHFSGRLLIDPVCVSQRFTVGLSCSVVPFSACCVVPQYRHRCVHESTQKKIVFSVMDTALKNIRFARTRSCSKPRHHRKSGFKYRRRIASKPPLPLCGHAKRSAPWSCRETQPSAACIWGCFGLTARSFLTAVCVEKVEDASSLVRMSSF